MLASANRSRDWQDHICLFLLQPGSTTGSGGLPGAESALAPKLGAGEIDRAMDKSLFDTPSPAERDIGIIDWLAAIAPGNVEEGGRP